MIALPAFTNTNTRPRPGSKGAAATGFERWNEAVSKLTDPARQDHAAALAVDDYGRPLLEAVFGNSPFLTRCLIHHVGIFLDWCEAGPDHILGRIVAEAAAAGEAEAEAAVMATLRRARTQAALAIGLADIAGIWDVARSTRALSDFADAAIGAALNHLVRAAERSGALPPPDGAAPAHGLFVLGMGKLGGRELNYSSDIDIIVFYDPDRPGAPAPDQALQLFVRMTRDLVRILEARTADGYVFRTDLRLRPDPGATPPAISVLAAETYYESLGQNWERAAMIRARAVAGDLEGGRAFLRMLRPFVWRKHLDFAAIQDIHSIKRQIHAHKGGGKIAIAGHNIKLGRGGIREIEFFAQTQQLIFGGRAPELRVAPTCEALRALAEAGRIEDETAAEMTEAYGFLRRLEHRLQMVEDQQTHALPKDPSKLAAIAAFMGFPDTQAFSTALETRLRTVERHYADLFEEAPELGGPGNLVFTGGEHDPDTLETLSRLGYREPERVSAIVRAWHHGRYRAMRSTRAREILTELMPALLDALAKTPAPDEAFIRFDEFLAAQPAGVQLFSMIHANPGLLELVADIMGSAPSLAKRLGGDASLFEAVLSEGFYDPLPGREELAADLAAAQGDARSFEDVLVTCVRWANDRRFQAGIQYFRGLIDVTAMGAALSDIADTVLDALAGAVEHEFAHAHGTIPGGGLVVLALGKLGSRETTVSSDLDLILLYDAPEGVEQSDGPKPLAPTVYYTRLIQRLLSAVTALTPEGRLYEVDMRLRPSGNKGPLATSFASFQRYQEKDAWTWEHMALTRARVVYGVPALAEKVGGAIRAVLTRPRDPEKLVRDIAEMRVRMDREHHTDVPWQVKHRRGGLVDVEFLAQYLQLRHAAAHPEVLSTNTAAAFERLADAGCLDKEIASRLAAAMRFWLGLQSMLRLTVREDFDETTAPAGLRAILARAVGAEGFEDLKARMAETAAEVHGRFRAMIEAPAAALAAKAGSEGKGETRKERKR